MLFPSQSLVKFHYFLEYSSVWEHGTKQIEDVLVYCHKRNYFMPNYHQVCNLSDTTGATSRAGTDYLSGAYESPVFSGVCISQSIVFGSV